MKRATFFLISIVLASFSLSAVEPRNDAPQDFLESFKNPSQSARPRVWWHWMNGNITRDGLYKDLHWMQDVGVVGFHCFDAGLETPQVVEHRIPYMTEEWKETFKYALDVADSLGMEVTIASSPGWSETGGPWVSADDAMKKLVWREMEIEGNSKLQTIRLPEGFNCSGIFQDDKLVSWDTDLQEPYYRDIAIVAVRLGDEETSFNRIKPKVSASRLAEGSAPATVENLGGDGIKDGVRLVTDENGESWIQYEFETPVTVRSVVLSDRKRSGDVYAVNRCLFSSDDGVRFRKVKDLGYQATVQKTYSLPETTARFFRIKICDTNKVPGCEFNLFQCRLSCAPRIQDAGDKTGFGMYRLSYLEDSVPADGAPSIDDVVDVSAYFKDGMLGWAVPDGRWRIFRFGYSLTGKTNHPASPEATGFEVDKLDREAVGNYLRNYLATYEDASGGRMGEGGIEYMLTDSYEAGPQTWTPNMAAEFEARKGYSLLKWMPALTGMVIGSTEETERFLFDWRGCIGEMIAQNHYDIQNEVLAHYGMKRYTESHENYRAYLADGMDCKRLAEVPMSAFWMTYKQGGGFTPRFEADIRESASVAHIYGQNIAAAESFTSDGFRDGAWVFSPSVLKPQADAAMASGLNRFIIHCSTHQPVDSLKPGLGLGKWGQWFNRHQTWANEADCLTDYLSRSCALLQAGRFVADVAVYYGEDNNVTGIYHNDYPDVPEGYNYDYFNPTALLDVARVEDGCLVTPTGMKYSVLSLGPNVRNVSIKVLRRLAQFADEGLPICGSVPYKLAGMEGSRAEFDSLVNYVWNSGRPMVKKGTGAAAELLKRKGLRKDFDCPFSDIRFVHRTDGDREIYWISNSSDEPRDFEASFRVSGGLKASILNAEDGSCIPAEAVSRDGRSFVKLYMHPHQSLSVVLSKDGLAVAEPVWQLSGCETRIVRSIPGPWTVEFESGRGAPASASMDELHSLSDDIDEGIKYFSGEAVYKTEFKLSSKDFREGCLMLDLGTAWDIATVCLNGKELGTLWHGPYLLDLGGVVRKGLNTLEIKVVNTWHNRIVGDVRPGVTKRVTYYPIDLLEPQEPLLPSGLIGPVSICVKNK